MLNNQNRQADLSAGIGASPIYSDGRISFDALLTAGPRRIIVTADLIEEHALRRPMSAPELATYAATHRPMLLRAAEAISAATPHVDPILINRIDQLV